MAVLTRETGGAPLSAEEANEVISAFDRNGDNALNLSEFIAALSSLDEDEQHHVAVDVVNAALRPEVQGNLSTDQEQILDEVRTEVGADAVAANGGGGSSSSSWMGDMLVGGLAVAGAVAIGMYIWSEHKDEIRELAQDGVEGLVEVVESIESGAKKYGAEAKDAAIVLWQGARKATEHGKAELSEALRAEFASMRESAGEFKAEIDELCA